MYFFASWATGKLTAIPALQYEYETTTSLGTGFFALLQTSSNYLNLQSASLDHVLADLRMRMNRHVERYGETKGRSLFPQNFLVRSLLY